MQDRQLVQFGANAICPRLGSSGIGKGKNHHKLLSSKATHDIFRAHASLEKSRGFAQHSIASIVTVGVIEVLEMIQIEHHYPHRLLGAQSAPDFAFEDLFQITAIE